MAVTCDTGTSRPSLEPGEHPVLVLADGIELPDGSLPAADNVMRFIYLGPVAGSTVGWGSLKCGYLD